MSQPFLHLDWCSRSAARVACARWHYSGCLPAGRLIKVGVWEAGKFVGCVIFGRGASPRIGAPFGLPQTEVCELVRVALCEHQTPVSRINRIALKLLRKNSPGMRLVVSFADTEQGHHGGIYVAGGWLYLGASCQHRYRIHGRLIHPISCTLKYGTQSVPKLRAQVDPNAARVPTAPKHKYVFPLDKSLRAKLLPQTKPYPKRTGSAEGGTPGDQPGGAGSTPSPVLFDSITD